MSRGGVMWVQPKPRIRLVRGAREWVCLTARNGGCGPTPKRAYETWLKARRLDR